MSWYYISLKPILACLILLSRSQLFIICWLSLYIIRKYMQLYFFYNSDLQAAKNMILQLVGTQYGLLFLMVPFNQICYALHKKV